MPFQTAKYFGNPGSKTSLVTKNYLLSNGYVSYGFDRGEGSAGSAAARWEFSNINLVDIDSILIVDVKAVGENNDYDDMPEYALNIELHTNSYNTTFDKSTVDIGLGKVTYEKKFLDVTSIIKTTTNSYIDFIDLIVSKTTAASPQETFVEGELLIKK